MWIWGTVNGRPGETIGCGDVPQVCRTIEDGVVRGEQSEKGPIKDNKQIDVVPVVQVVTKGRRASESDGVAGGCRQSTELTLHARRAPPGISTQSRTQPAPSFCPNLAPIWQASAPFLAQSTPPAISGRFTRRRGAGRSPELSCSSPQDMGGPAASPRRVQRCHPLKAQSNAARPSPTRCPGTRSPAAARQTPCAALLIFRPTHLSTSCPHSPHCSLRLRPLV